MKKFLTGVALASSLLIGSAANAALIVGFDLDNNGSFEVQITDNSSSDINTDTGNIVAGANNFAAINVGYVLDNPFNLHMTASSSNRNSTTTFGTTITDLTLADLSSAVFLGGGSTTGISTMSAYLDTGNAAFGMSDVLLGTFSDSGAFSFNFAQYLISDQDTFSLTLVSKIVGSGSTDTDIKVSEPSILALFGLGLVGLGFSARRRKA
jgi:hypothetical protein